MLVQCPQCNTKYNLDENQVAPQGSKVRCSRCATVFTAFRPDSPETVNAQPKESISDPIAPETDTSLADQSSPQSEKESPSSAALADFDDEWENWPAQAKSSSTPAAPRPSSFEDEFDAIFSDKSETPSPPQVSTPPAADSIEDDLDQFAAEKEDKSETKASAAASKLMPAVDSFDDELDALFDQAKKQPPTPKAAKDDLVADLEGAFQQPLLDKSGADNKSEDVSSRPKKSSRVGLLFGVLLLLIALLGAGIYFKFIGLPVIDSKPAATNTTAPSDEAPVSAAQISLENVRQYFVPNEKEGQLFIIEGKAVNRFTEAREMLRLKATLFDKQGEAVTTQEFMCGNVVTLYQLQVSSRQDIEAALGAKVGILTNNTNIQPGASVPFMTVFFDTPDSVEEFGLEVVQSQSRP